MAKKKGEAFALEYDILNKARLKLEEADPSVQELKENYSHLCEEYEKLLDEAKFLTKVSDKLEAKLSKANDQLAEEKDHISAEKSLVEGEMGKVLKKNKRLNIAKSELDDKQNKLQLTLVIIIAVLMIIVVVFIYMFWENTNKIDNLVESKKKNEQKIQDLLRQNEGHEDHIDKLKSGEHLKSPSNENGGMDEHSDESNDE